MKRYTIILCLWGLLFSNCYSQEYSKSAIQYGVGISLSGATEYNTSSGREIIVGYKRDIWKDRLRLNPNLVLGYFKGEIWEDNLRDQSFNTIQLRVLLDYDLIRYKRVSLNTEIGGIIGKSLGLKGTGFTHDRISYEDIPETKSEYIDRLNIGGVIGGGIRYSFLGGRYAVKFMPLNIHLGNGFHEIHSYVSVDIKLKE